MTFPVPPPSPPPPPPPPPTTTTGLATYEIVQSDTWCSGAWGVERNSLGTAADIAACEDKSRADSGCGDEFYYCTGDASCRCILPGQSCTTSSSASCDLARSTVLYKIVQADTWCSGT